MDKQKNYTGRSGIWRIVQSLLFFILFVIASGLCVFAGISSLVSITLLNRNFNSLLLAIIITGIAAIFVLIISSWRTIKHIERKSELNQYQEKEHARIERLIEKQAAAQEIIEENYSPQNEQNSL